MARDEFGVESNNKMWTLYYDGGCNLCHASQIRAVRWAQRAGQALNAVPLQSVEAAAKGYTLDGMVLERDGSVYKASRAWIELLAIAPWYLRWIHWVGKVPGIRSILSWGYGIVAKYRLKWFGTRECSIHGQADPLRQQRSE